jgi:hypothetical protein
MARATTVLAATTLVGCVASLWLYIDNRSLRDQLEQQKPPPEAPADAPKLAARASDPVAAPARSGPAHSWQIPQLAAPNEESRLDRRARRQQELSAMFGRSDGESEDEYRSRISPLIKGALAIPRQRVEDMRKVAEEKAKVSPAQSKQLDMAFQKVYADTLAYTNKAIADGTLSPYERNVASWLEFGGGLGGILQEANGTIGQVLSPDQMRAMYDSGFEWGEYLGLEAPWEQLNPPPPPKR